MRGPSPVLLLALLAIWLGCHEPVKSVPSPGTIEVSVSASGLLTDTATYGVAVSRNGGAGPTDRRVPYAGGQVSYEGLVPGTYAVRLESPGSCWVVWGDQALRVVVAAGSTTHLHFDTSCFGPPDKVLTRTASESNLPPTRFILEPGGAFRLQYQDGRGTESVGTYSYGDAVLRFDFAVSDDEWTATATVSGSCLSVDFNQSMEWADFVDGTYCGDVPTIGDFAASMPEARWGHAAAALNGMVYVAGGWGIEAERPTSILVYDPARDEWRTAGQLVRPVGGAATAAIGGRLYLAGGYHESGPDFTAGLQIFDPVSGVTTLGPPLPTPRGGPAAAVLDGKLHVLGGERPPYDVSEEWYPTSAHEVFDPATGTWSTRAGLPHSRTGQSAVTLDGRIYVTSGDLLQVYDPATDGWTTYSSPPVRWGAATIAVGGVMYAIGGVDGLTQPVPSAAVQRYAPSTRAWGSAAPLAVPRAGHAAALVNGTIYVLGGYSSPGGAAVPLVERLRVP